MTTLIHAAPTVKITRPTCRACGAADFHRDGCPVEHETTCRVLPADCRPEATAADIPSWEDAQWWAVHCDHDGGCHPADLTPEEQDAEWERSELLEERAAMVASWDRYERGLGWE